MGEAPGTAIAAIRGFDLGHMVLISERNLPLTHSPLKLLPANATYEAADISRLCSVPLRLTPHHPLPLRLRVLPAELHALLARTGILAADSMLLKWDLFLVSLR